MLLLLTTPALFRNKRKYFENFLSENIHNDDCRVITITEEELANLKVMPISSDPQLEVNWKDIHIEELEHERSVINRDDSDYSSVIHAILQKFGSISSNQIIVLHAEHYENLFINTYLDKISDFFFDLDEWPYAFILLVNSVDISNLAEAFSQSFYLVPTILSNSEKKKLFYGLVLKSIFINFFGYKMSIFITSAWKKIKKKGLSV